MVRLASLLLVCAACFADNPPVLGTGGSGDASTSSGATGVLSTGETTGAGSSGSATGAASTGGAPGTSTGPDVGTTAVTGEPGTTGTTGTTGTAGTTGEATTDGGTTEAPPWIGCMDAPSQQQCVGCCGAEVKASELYYMALGTCLCEQGSPCHSVCQFSLCVGGNPSANCATCAANDGFDCLPAAVEKCQSDPDCAEFLACVDGSGCAGKP